MARHLALLPLFVLFAISVILGFSNALDFLEEPDHTTATVGDGKVELRCVVDGKAQIKWFKARKNIEEDFVKLTVFKSGLRISNVQIDDEGDYYCQASNSLKTITSRTATLTVQYICDTIQIKADPNVVFQNEDVDLTCDCSGNPSPSYTWTKDGSLLGGSGKILRISKAQIKDSGIYQCIANNSVRMSPRTSDQHHLNITDGAPPKIVQPPRKEVAFVLRGTVMLNCVATGDPAPVVKWYHERSNDALSNNTVMQIFSNGSLLLKRIKKRNAGSYKCVAINIYDTSKSFESELVLAYIERIRPLPEQVVRRGNTLSVECKPPKAKPAILNVEWTLGNGAPLPSGGRFTVTGNELQIQKTVKSDSGIYQCIARNIAGERRLNVTVIAAIFPEVLQNPQNQTIIEGQDTILECGFSGDPKPKIVWEKNEEALRNDQDDYKINGSQLIIENARPEFNGLYSCEASIGNIRRRSKKGQLTVQEKIKITKSDRYKFEIGSTARLQCQVRGTKPWKITWSKVGSSTKLLPPHITEEGVLLIIKKSKLGDSGNYSCEVANSFSSSSTIMVLNINKRPVIVIYPQNVTAKLNGTAIFHCNMTGYPTPSIVWYKDIPKKLEQKWESLKNTDRVKQFPNGSLRFRNIRKTDEGGYSCLGGNAGGFNRVSVYLTLKEATSGSNDESSDDMAKTVGIAVGCAGAYIILVVGLMIYCKGRRARQAKNKLVLNGEEIPLNVADANNVEVIKTADTKLQFPRHDLEALRTLGNGSYGNVFLAKASEIVEGESTSIVVVQSLTSKDEEVKKEFMKTMAKLSLKHKNIGKLLGVCQEEDPMYLISEYPEQGDLKTLMRDSSSPLTPTQKVNICAEVASGMNYLTNHGHVHKDLAARNCLVNKSFNVKISFLSLNQGTYPKEYYKRNGELIPLRWMAPEALKGSFDEVSDVWSFGILMWEVYTEGILPYEERSDEEVHKSVPYDLRLTKPESCPGKIFKMMEQCWEEEGEDRPTFGQLCEDFSEIPRENDF